LFQLYKRELTLYDQVMNLFSCKVRNRGQEHFEATKQEKMLRIRFEMKEIFSEWFTITAYTSASIMSCMKL